MNSFAIFTDFPLLSFENIRGINGRQQHFHKRYDLVKCGNVFDVNWSLSDVHLHVFSYVHSEKTSSQFYHVDLMISSQSLNFLDDLVEEVQFYPIQSHQPSVSMFLQYWLVWMHFVTVQVQSLPLGLNVLA